MLANYIGNIGVASVLFNGSLIFSDLPQSTELRHAYRDRFDELEEVNFDFLGDKVCLFNTCVVVVVDAAKDRTELRLHELNMTATCCDLPWFDVDSCSLL